MRKPKPSSFPIATEEQAKEFLAELWRIRASGQKMSQARPWGYKGPQRLPVCVKCSRFRETCQCKRPLFV